MKPDRTRAFDNFYERINRYVSILFPLCLATICAGFVALEMRNKFHLAGALCFGIFLVISLGFAMVLDACFWTLAKTRFHLFVYEWETHGERLIYVRNKGEDFFIPPGQELVIRSPQEPGQSVEILSGPTDQAPKSEISSTGH